jgi:hypothetical protein
MRPDVTDKESADNAATGKIRKASMFHIPECWCARKLLEPKVNPAR